MAVMDAVDTEASLTKFKSLVREKEKKAKRRSISVRWGRYASATAAFLAQVLFSQAELRGDCFPINFLIIQ